MRRLLLLAFIWGWSFLFIKVAVEGLSPPTVAFGRVGLGAAVLLAVLGVQGRGLPRDRQLWRRFAIAALFGNVLPFTLLAWGEQRITSGLTAVLNASTPLFTAIAAAVYLGDRLKRRQVAGLLLGFVGVAVAAGFGGRDLADSSILGSLAAVGAGALYGIAFAYMRGNLTAIRPIVAAAGQLVVATVMLAPFAVATSISSGVDLTWRRGLALAALGIVGTGLAYIINYRVLADLGATKASLVTYVIPVVAVAVGVVVLSEPFELRLIAGGVLIAGGIMLVHARRFRPVAAVAVLLVAGMSGCGSTGASSVCRPAVREALDINLSHVLVQPGAPEPKYLTDPPTSGPHAPGLPPTGVISRSLSRPAQVGALEGGIVLLQHRDLSTDELRQLSELAGPQVVVAPNADLPDRLVATAWLFKQTCSGVDLEALRSFAAEHQGKGPGTDG